MSLEADRSRPGGARRASRSVRLSRRERRALRREATHSGGRRALRPGDPAPARPADVPRGGRRIDRRRRRTQGLPGTVGITFLGAVIPGSGYLYAGRRLIGGVVLAGWLAILIGLLVRFGTDWHRDRESTRLNSSHPSI